MLKNKDEQQLDKQRLKKMEIIFRNSLFVPFEYRIQEDKLLVYNQEFQIVKEIPNYISYIESHSVIHPEDKWKAIEFYQKRLQGPVEIRVYDENHELRRKVLEASLYVDDEGYQEVLLGTARDITIAKQREKTLEDQAQKDSLTQLYNQTVGKKLISEYLDHKNPYDSCGLIVVDIDYFKNVNDRYGHLVGDVVLKQISKLFMDLFHNKDILMRVGGDEFVIFLKDISHPSLVKKVMKLIKSVQEMKIQEVDWVLTCSAGVCFLPENVSGYTYNQLFKNADWALYRAKEYGRNQYVFCDNLQRFELMTSKHEHRDIDIRFLHNDIVSSAFEIFEKNNSFKSAIELLFEVIGLRLHLDRISIIHTDLKDNKVNRQYQWVSEGTPEVLASSTSFQKKDFLTLFQSYDEHGVTVLQYDKMDMYSPEGANLLVQGDAKTVVYAAMYCEGKYTGAISYVTCKNQRYWSQQNLQQISELTKIISVHLEKYLAINATNQSLISKPGYDRLTGLLAFPKFREEVERFIVGGYVKSHVMVYSDFENFTYINQKFGYAVGDQLLKEFSHFIIGTLKNEEEVYFTRVVSDQFIIFMPYDQLNQAEQKVNKINQLFISQCSLLFPGMKLRIRTGIYHVKPDCISASTAIDAANYARKSITSESEIPVKLYDDELDQKRLLEKEIITGMDTALNNHEFKVYMQPKFSLNDFSVIGAEALVRWQRDDGNMLYPDSFIPLYESNGRITDLDFYVFEEVVAFLAKNNSLGRKQVPISINASILHAHNMDTTKKYLDILKKYHVDPSLVEIELTETDTISAYDNVKKMFTNLCNEHIKTALDDFGAGYSILNSVIEIPVDTIKIDKEFIKNCEKSEKGIYFLQQLIMILKQLGYKVICEGVETQRQIDILKEAGCEMGQGYFFSRPVSIEEYEKVVYAS